MIGLLDSCEPLNKYIFKQLDKIWCVIDFHIKFIKDFIILYWIPMKSDL